MGRLHSRNRLEGIARPRSAFIGLRSRALPFLLLGDYVTPRGGILVVFASLNALAELSAGDET